MKKLQGISLYPSMQSTSFWTDISTCLPTLQYCFYRLVCVEGAKERYEYQPNAKILCLPVHDGIFTLELSLRKTEKNTAVDINKKYVRYCKKLSPLTKKFTPKCAFLPGIVSPGK